GRRPRPACRRARSSFGGLAAERVVLALHRVEVARHHLLDQLRERRGVPPAELVARLRRVAEQELDLGRAEVTPVDLDQHLAALRVDALLVDARAAPGDRAPGLGE